MSAESVATPAAGWYPDPADPAGLRWWSGSAWTEHTSVPAAPMAAAAPSAPDDDAPDLSRFARDPGARPTVAEVPLPTQRDPYRDRNVLAGLGLVVALLSIPATVVSAFVDLGDFVGFFISGAPITFALLGLVASFKMGYRTRMAWLAVAISIVTMAVGYAISAQQFQSVLDTYLTR